MPQAWQTDYAETISTTHFEGTPAEPLSELRSERIAQVVIPAGRLVVPGTTEKQLKLPTSAAEVTKAYGVSILMPLKSEAGTDFAIGDAVLFAEDGVVWVVVEEAVADGDPVLARHTANGAGKDVLGRFRTSADTGSSALPSARFRSASVTFGSLLLAKLKFDLPATA
jgi:hypothetical protein